MSGRGAMRALAAALTAVANRLAGGHWYLSTSCLHGRHDYCRSNTGSNPAGQQWDKKPGQCKFCEAPCRCRCHTTNCSTGGPR